MKSAWVYDDRLSVNSDLCRQIALMGGKFLGIKEHFQFLSAQDLFSLLLSLSSSSFLVSL